MLAFQRAALEGVTLGQPTANPAARIVRCCRRVDGARTLFTGTESCRSGNRHRPAGSCRHRIAHPDDPAGGGLAAARALPRGHREAGVPLAPRNHPRPARGRRLAGQHERLAARQGSGIRSLGEREPAGPRSRPQSRAAQWPPAATRQRLPREHAQYSNIGNRAHRGAERCGRHHLRVRCGQRGGELHHQAQFRRPRGRRRLHFDRGHGRRLQARRDVGASR